MITVEEARRIRDAADRVEDASTEWGNALRRGADQESLDAAATRWESARKAFHEALIAVTDYSTTTEVAR